MTKWGCIGREIGERVFDPNLFDRPFNYDARRIFRALGFLA